MPKPVVEIKPYYPSGVWMREQIRELVKAHRGAELDRRTLKLSRKYREAVSPLFLKKQYFTQNDAEFVEGIIALVKREHAKGNGKVLVAVSGLRGAGKSRLAGLVVERLRELGIKAAKAGLDAYGKSPEKMREAGGLDHPANMDWKQVKSLIAAFRKGKAISVRDLDYDSPGGKRVVETNVMGAQVLLVEGIHAFAPSVEKPDVRAFAFVPPGLQTLKTAYRDRRQDAKRERLRAPEIRQGWNYRVRMFEDYFILPLVRAAHVVYMRPYAAKDFDRIFRSTGKSTKEYVQQLAALHGITLPVEDD